jgi:hypothetical protein
LSTQLTTRPTWSVPMIASLIFHPPKFVADALADHRSFHLLRLAGRHNFRARN